MGKMDDEAKKALAETWTTGDADEVRRGARTVCRVEFVDDRDDEPMALVNAREAIAACAPEALRLLLEEEVTQDSEYGDYCGRCGADKDVFTSKVPHAPDCHWLALMQKAGLR